MILCAKIPESSLPWREQSEDIIGTSFTGFADCNSGGGNIDRVAVGRCAGGKNRDCRDEGRSFAHELSCAPKAPGVVLDRSSKNPPIAVCKNGGQLAVCPTGYVVTKSCGAGASSDCDTDICANRGNVYSAIECVKMDLVTFDSVSENPTPIEVERAIVKEDCRTEDIPNGATKDFTETVKIEVSQSLSLSFSESTSTSFSTESSVSLENKISASAGLPKLGLGVGASTTVSASLTARMEFDKDTEYREVLQSKTTELKERTVGFSLDGGHRYRLMQFGTQLIPKAQYGLNYVHHQPLAPPSPLLANTTITVKTASTEIFFVVLSDAEYSDALLAQDCKLTALQYVNLEGEFASDGSDLSYDFIPVSGSELPIPDSDEDFASSSPKSLNVVLLLGLLFGSLHSIM